MKQTEAIHIALKRLLKKEGLTYEDVAEYLDLSTSNIKRLFAKNLLSLDRIEALCSWLNIDFVELAEAARLSAQATTQLTLAQEKQLIKEPKLFLVTYLLLNHWKSTEIDEVFGFTQSEMTKILVKLDRMKIIELLPLNRVRLLTARNFSWHPHGPVSEFLSQAVLKEFMQTNFSLPGESIEFISGMLSKNAIEKAHKLIKHLAEQFDTLIAEDLNLPISERHAVSLLCGFRPWEFSLFSQYRQSTTKKIFE